MPSPGPTPIQQFREAWNEWLPLGLAPTVIVFIGVVTGVALLFYGIDTTKPDLTFVTFANPHYEAAKKTTPSFNAAEGVTAEPRKVHESVVTRRLRAAYAAGLELPDLVEVEITWAGTFFRGPSEEIPFIDLKPRLIESGMMDRIVQTRLSPYTVKHTETGEEMIVGLPHDVHPVTIAYRKDLFDELGIDVEKIKTWDDFIAVGRKVTVPGERYMIQFDDTNTASYEVLLFQAGGAFFDAEGKLVMDSGVAFDTLVWFIPLVAGDNRIAANPGSFGQAFYRAVEEGYVMSFICPDWRAGSTKTNLPGLEGKMAMMPMPAFEPGGRRTSTWGGTMIGITRTSPDPDLAWRYALHMYMDRETIADNFRETFILPPFKDVWDEPAFHEPSKYYSGQKVGELYMSLADDVPPQFGSPYIALAKAKMSEVIAACSAYYRSNGDEGFAEFARKELDAAAEYVRFQMQRNPF